MIFVNGSMSCKCVRSMTNRPGPIHMKEQSVVSSHTVTILCRFLCVLSQVLSVLTHLPLNKQIFQFFQFIQTLLRPQRTTIPFKNQYYNI